MRQVYLPTQLITAIAEHSGARGGVEPPTFRFSAQIMAKQQGH